MLQKGYRPPFWTDDEISLLHRWFSCSSKKELEEIFPGRIWRSIKAKGKSLDLEIFPANLTNVLWSQDEEDRLVRMWPLATAKELGESFPYRSAGFLCSRAMRSGVRCETERQRNGDISPLLGESLEAYYWAGFIAADGHVNLKQGQLVVGLGKKDRDHLEKLAAFIKTDVHDMEERSQCRITVADATLLPDFASRFGFAQRKTETPPDLSWLREDALLAFFAGFVDGDGSFCWVGNSLSLRIELHSSWVNVLRFFESSLSDILDTPVRKTARIQPNGYSKMQIGISLTLKILGERVANLSVPTMSRKWDKIGDLRCKQT